MTPAPPVPCHGYDHHHPGMHDPCPRCGCAAVTVPAGPGRSGFGFNRTPKETR